MAFNKLNKVWKSSLLSHGTKITIIFKTNEVAVLLYGCETRGPTKVSIEETRVRSERAGKGKTTKTVRPHLRMSPDKNSKIAITTSEDGLDREEGE